MGSQLFFGIASQFASLTKKLNANRKVDVLITPKQCSSFVSFADCVVMFDGVDNYFVSDYA